ncbi:MAG: 50S ribosomal protein L21 [Pseudomonadota bacterium]
MFAVIKTGGKQYSVKENDTIRVEKLAGETGDMIELNEVLMIGDEVGMPLVDGAVVTAEIVDQSRARKVIAFKKRRRQNSRRKIGHRQHYTELLISELLGKGEKPKKKATGIGAERAAAKAARAANGGRSAAADGIAEAPAAAPAKAAKEEKPAKAEAPAENGTAKPAPEGPLFAAPAGGEKDKLTDIKGIGPVAEKQLNEQGITTFKQIAELSADDIQRVDDYMPFSSAQIEDWQSQAKEKIA